MPAIALRNEPEVIRKLLREKSADYGLDNLVKSENILTKQVGFFHQFPCIMIIKAGATIEGFVGDQMDNERGEFQPTTVTVTSSTMKNINKVYDSKNYSDADLARLIGEVVQQILFDYKEYEDPDNPGFLYVVDFLTAEAETDSFASLAPIFSVRMTFQVLFRTAR